MSKGSAQEGDRPPTHLDPAERKKAVEEEKLNAAVTHEVIRREGMKELHRQPAPHWPR